MSLLRSNDFQEGRERGRERERQRERKNERDAYVYIYIYIYISYFLESVRHYGPHVFQLKRCFL